MQTIAIELQQLESNLIFLKELKEPSKILNERYSFTIFLDLKNLIQDEYFLKSVKDWNIFLKHNFDHIVVQLFVYISKLSDHLKIKNFKYSEIDSKKDIDLNDRSLSILVFLIQITNNLTELSSLNESLKEFNRKLLQNKILTALLLFLDREKFLEQYTKHLDTHHLIISILRLIRNFSENGLIDEDLCAEVKLIERIEKFKKVCRYENLFIQEYNRIQINLEQKSIEKSLYDIYKIKEANKILIDKDSYKNFLFLYKQSINNLITNNNYEIFMIKEFQELFQRLLKQLYESRYDLDFKTHIIELVYPKKSIINNEKKISIFFYLTSLLNSTYDYLIKKKGQQNYIFDSFKYEILKLYLNILSDKKFVRNLKKSSADIILNLIHFVNIHKQDAILNKEIWSKLSVFEILLDLSKRFYKSNKNKINKHIFLCYWVMSYLIPEDRLDSEMFVKTIIELIFEKLNDESYNKIFNEFQIPTFNLLDCLRRLGLNNTIKEIIYENINTLKKIILIGNEKEKIYSLRIIIQLCFNKDILNDMLSDDEFKKFIKKVRDTKLKITKINPILDSILWLFDHKNSKLFNHNQQPIEYSIIISHDYTNKDICEKLRNTLVKHGYNCELSSNDTFYINMTKCLAIIVCISEVYRLSEFCQIKTRYANELGKEVILLVCQEGYENINGWLGDVLNDKFKIYMIEDGYKKSTKLILKYLSNLIIEKENEENIEKLSSKIETSSILVSDRMIKESDYQRSLNINEQKLNKRMPDIEYIEKSVLNWDENDVINWFKYFKINNRIINAYGKIDGKTLYKIYKIKSESKDFFYQRLLNDTNDKIKLNDIALFSTCLDTLFEESNLNSQYSKIY